MVLPQIARQNGAQHQPAGLSIPAVQISGNLMRLAHALLGLCVFAFSSPALAAGLSVSEQTLTQNGPRYTIDLKYPATGVGAIDAVIAEFAAARRDEMLPYFTDPEAVQYLPEDMGMFAELNYGIGRNDSEWFSVMFTYFTFAGGAHPNTMQYGMNFLVADGGLVELAEIIGHDGIKFVSAYAVSDIDKQFGNDGIEVNDEWVLRGAGPRESNFAAFNWGAETMTIIFPAYQVAPYAAGPVTVEIPTAKLAPFVRDDVRAPIASFDCAKAGTAVEKGICADAGVARLDRHVADAYAEQLLWLTEEAQITPVRQAQRDFIKARDAACGGKAAGDAMTQCLTDAYTARLAAIRAG